MMRVFVIENCLGAEIAFGVTTGCLGTAIPGIGAAATACFGAIGATGVARAAIGVAGVALAGGIFGLGGSAVEAGLVTCGVTVGAGG